MLCGGLTSVFFFLGHVVMPVEEDTCVFTISSYFSTMSVSGGVVFLCLFKKRIKKRFFFFNSACVHISSETCLTASSTTVIDV